MSAVTAMAADSPRPSPPLTIERLGAPSVELSQYRGKVVALAFIFTTCSHCQDLTKLLGPLSREYALRGVQVLECAFNDDAEGALPMFVARFRPAYPVGWSNQVEVRTYLNVGLMDGHFMVPHMVFLDRRGIIQADYPGESDFMKDPATNIRAELEKLLKAR